MAPLFVLHTKGTTASWDLRISRLSVANDVSMSLAVYGRTAVWQFRGRLEPRRSRLRILKRGKAWQYQALSVGCLFFGATNKTWIRSKPRMRKTMTIPTLTHHIETRSSWDWRSRRKNSFNALPVFALSISSLDISLAG
jgi:hypothetical protein